MKRILLVCSGGMSTTILVKKMLDVAKERGEEVIIEARGNSDLESIKNDWDCCLIAPQIRFSLSVVTEKLEMPVEVIDMRVYGMGDGAAELDQAYKLLQG